jgi:beta-lactamase regulating signal transducer with metallopeptidase domain
MIASTALLTIVIVARPFVRRHVGARHSYALWLLPAMRLATPGIPLLVGETVVLSGRPESTALAVAPMFWVFAIACWLGGAALLFASHLLRYRRFVLRARASCVGPAERIAGIVVRQSGAVDGPVATGLWRREIFLPLDFAHRFDVEERRLALEHEVMHHRRGDILANLAASFVLALHWFDPIAHYAHRLFRADQELACDADVLANAKDACRHSYGRALFKASRGGAMMGCALGDVALLKLRLRFLTAGSASRRRWSGVVPLIGVLVMAGSAVTHASTRFETAAAVSPAAPLSVQARQTFDSGAVAPAAAIRPARPPRLATKIRSDVVAVSIESKQPETHLDSAYLEQRRALGLRRSERRFSTPADAAAARGRPLIEPPQTG